MDIKDANVDGKLQYNICVDLMRSDCEPDLLWRDITASKRMVYPAYPTEGSGRAFARLQNMYVLLGWFIMRNTCEIYDGERNNAGDFVGDSDSQIK
jgi:hypothetical protein